MGELNVSFLKPATLANKTAKETTKPKSVAYLTFKKMELLKKKNDAQYNYTKELTNLNKKEHELSSKAMLKNQEEIKKYQNEMKKIEEEIDKEIKKIEKDMKEMKSPIPLA